MAKKEKVPEEPPMIEEYKGATPSQDFSAESVLEQEKDDSGGESFFRKIIDNLFSSRNVGAKTEFINEEENFQAAKLEFISGFGNVPAIKNFLTIWETKRISLKRQGRIEIINALEKRQEEMDYQRSQQLLQRGGLM